MNKKVKNGSDQEVTKKKSPKKKSVTKPVGASSSAKATDPDQGDRSEARLSAEDRASLEILQE